MRSDSNMTISEISRILARKTYDNRRKFQKILDFPWFLLVFAMFPYNFLSVFKDYPP